MFNWRDASWLMLGMIGGFVLFLWLLIFATAVHAAALSADANIYRAEVVRVIDGDTVLVKIVLWPDLVIAPRIRQLDIDTPELKGKCKAERELAVNAKAYTQNLLPVGELIDISGLKNDKYGGRYNASIFIAGESLARLLVDAGLARPYSGGKRESWC